jgi:iron(III) transport system substrate-binding protein
MINRRTWFRSASTVVVAGALLVTAGCAATPEAASNVVAGELPSYYPADYDQIIEASKEEGGELVIASGTSQENWAPIFRDFKAKYPWVTTILAKESGAEMYQQLLSEISTDSVQTDLHVVSSTQGWADYASHEGAVAEYRSPELAELPEYAELLPSVYAMSLDPMGMVYNTTIIDDELSGLGDLAEYAADHPGELEDKIVVRDAGTPFGFTVSQAWTESNAGNPDAWATFEELLPLSRAESSSGTQVEKILAGEYAAGFLISSAVGYPQEEKSGGLVKFVLPDDGTLLLGRGVGIVGKAPHPNTAKLFLDFVLSAEGQSAVAEGGLTSYREGVESTPGSHTYQDLVKEVGEDAMVVVPYVLMTDEEVEGFRDRFDELLNG